VNEAGADDDSANRFVFDFEPTPGSSQARQTGGTSSAKPSGKGLGLPPHLIVAIVAGISVLAGIAVLAIALSQSGDPTPKGNTGSKEKTVVKDKGSEKTTSKESKDKSRPSSKGSPTKTAPTEGDFRESTD
jgi:cytoskeletal protein RodZ